MTLKQLLLSDLERQYHYEGSLSKTPTVVGILKKSLNPRFTPVFLWRISHHCYVSRLTPIAKLVSLINFVIFGIEIGMRCEIGEGLYLPHTVGTVIGANKIGRNVVIFQGVTLGAKALDLAYQPEKRPTIGDNVTIGSGAKILGGIHIGNNVTIGANAVVTKSLPDNVVAVGIPAQIIRHIAQDSVNTYSIH
jgi:serine O-acetyltransferase